MDAFGSAVESTLGTAEGTPISELRPRLDKAIGYIGSWYDAVGSGDPFDLFSAAPVWSDRIGAVLSEINGVQAMMPPSDLFPGKDAVAAYNHASADFAQLYRDLLFSADTLPQPAVLDQVSDFFKVAIHAPVAAAKTLAEILADEIKKLLGNTAAAIWHALWPWILVAGAAGVVYVFRAPLGRALGRVAA